MADFLRPEVLKQLQEASSDEARQTAVFDYVIGELPDEVRDAAMVLAVPHWFSPPVLDLLGEKTIADSVPLLEASGVVVQQSEGTFSFPEAARNLLLQKLIASEIDRFRHLSEQYSRIFLELESETLATFIESIYHSLGADPKSGGRDMLKYGLRLKSEPLFQWDALDRLVANADEQDSRGVIDGESRVYSQFLKLFVPRLQPPPKVEIELLGKWRDSVRDNPAFSAELQLRLGSAETTTGDIDGARKNLLEAVSLCQKAGTPIGTIEAFRGLARLALRQDNYEEASRYFEEARVLAAQFGLTASVALSERGMAEIDFLQGRYVVAEAKFREAIGQFRDTGARLFEANSRVSIAQLLALQHRFGEAREHIDLATKVYAPIRRNLGLGNCAKALGLLFYEEGDPKTALDHLFEADARYAEAQNDTGLAYSNLLKASAWLARGMPVEAEHALNAASPVFARLGDRYGLALVRREAGRLALRQGRFKHSFELLNGAMAMFNSLPNPVEAASTFVDVASTAAQLGFPAGYDQEMIAGAAQRAALIFRENGLQHREQEMAHRLFGAVEQAAAATTQTQFEA